MKMDEMIDDVESLFKALEEENQRLINLLVESAGKDCHVRKIELKYKQAGEYPENTQVNLCYLKSK